MLKSCPVLKIKKIKKPAAKNNFKKIYTKYILTQATLVLDFYICTT